MYVLKVLIGRSSRLRFTTLIKTGQRAIDDFHISELHRQQVLALKLGIKLATTFEYLDLFFCQMPFRELT